MASDHVPQTDGTASGWSDHLVWGVCRAWDTVILRLRLAPEIRSSINLQA